MEECHCDPECVECCRAKMTKDDEVIKKYSDMPNLKSMQLDSDTKDSLKFAGIGLCLVVVAGVTMGMFGYDGHWKIVIN